MVTVAEFDAAITQSTSNLSAYNSGNITPVADQLLGAIVIASGTLADNATMTAAANGISTFHKIDRATFGPDLHSVYAFIANQKSTGTATMQVTFNCPSDPATGAIILPFALVGMTKVGSAAVRSIGGTPQVAKVNNGAGASAPVFNLGAGNNVLTTNPTLYGLGEISSAGVLNPTGWTQGGSGTYGTPTIGGAYGYRNSGYTGTGPTWPGNETAHGGLFIEFDASADAVQFVGWGVPM